MSPFIVISIWSMYLRHGCGIYGDSNVAAFTLQDFFFFSAHNNNETDFF